MRRSKLTNTLLLAGLISLWSMGAMAQEVRSEISVQGTGIFAQESNGRGIRETATETGGVLAGYRYHINRWLSAEAVYGWNRNSQEFTSAAASGRVQADVHQATGGLVVSVPVPRNFKIHPYVLAEGGALVFRPTLASGTIPGVDQQAVGAFVYGGGFDYPIPSLRKVALRFEYRGLVYKTPDFGLKALDADSISHTAQPSAAWCTDSDLELRRGKPVLVLAFVAQAGAWPSRPRPCVKSQEIIWRYWPNDKTSLNVGQTWI